MRSRFDRMTFADAFVIPIEFPAGDAVCELVSAKKKNINNNNRQRNIDRIFLHFLCSPRKKCFQLTKRTRTKYFK